MAIWLDAISDEWMLHVTRTMALPSRASCPIWSSFNPRGSASFLAVSRIFSRFRMFPSEVTTAMMKSSPSVVLPSISTRTRGDAAASARKYETICL